MLPDRSKRFAGPDEEIPRLTLVSNGQLVLVALMVVILMVVIFPRKALVEKLYDQKVLDELTLSYVQNLYRADTRNSDLALLLARSQPDRLGLTALEELLTPLAIDGDERQKLQARTMLIEQYEKLLDKKIEATQRAQIRVNAKNLLTVVSQEAMPKALAGRLANLAFDWDLPQLGLAFLDKGEGGRSIKGLERYAEVALADGNYAMSGEYYLLARDEAKELNNARRLFKLGISVLIQGGLYKLAMSSVENHLGSLDNDPETLRFVVRTAMQANDLKKVAEFGRRLVFLGNGRADSP